MAAVPVVELLGAPATGKSTLAAALVDERGARVLKDHELRDLPALAAAVRLGGLTYLLPRPPGVPLARRAAWITRLAAAPATVQRRRRDPCAGMVVLDQGPAYTLGRLRHLCLTERGKEWWGREARRAAELLDLVVLLEADLDTLQGRLHARAKDHPAAAMPAAEVRAYLRREQEGNRVVGKVLERIGARVLPLDSGQLDPGEQLAAVLGSLASRMPASGAGP